MSETIRNVLAATGLPVRCSRFPGPPAGTYAVYTDSVTTDGPDGIPAVLIHDVTVEIYEAMLDDAAETAVEQAIAAAGCQWTKQDRYWLQDEQRYQVVYEFTIYEKVRKQ